MDLAKFSDSSRCLYEALKLPCRHHQLQETSKTQHPDFSQGYSLAMQELEFGGSHQAAEHIAGYNMKHEGML